MQRLNTYLKRRSLTIYFVGNFKIPGSLSIPQQNLRHKLYSPRYDTVLQL